MRIPTINSGVWRLALLVLLLVGSTAVAGGRRSGGQPAPFAYDPELMELPPWMQPYEPLWGPGTLNTWGSWAHVGGSWDDLLKTGPTIATGVRWKYADWSGDLLPPSSTHFHIDYRYARFKGDHDAQLFAPGGTVAEVDIMRMYMLEAGVNQRFPAFLNGRGYFDVGTVFGIGAADAELSAVIPDPTKKAIFSSGVNQDGVIFRSAINAGVGVEFPICDFKFAIEGGLSGSNALGNGLRTQGDFGFRLLSTFFLW